MIIDFMKYLKIKQSQRLAAQTACDAEAARRARLEDVLGKLLSELQAA